ncbi:penicillin-binding protein 1A [Rhodobium gokarnense]|uniref:Penicillin-binding protein 1A n=1 Tax=Rhodobium gokarnense TaxID=364296 RepID=A0ABT3HAJ9_9HYPH|nr:penicillin-binding protein 1A [Rhodobium gokarnense]MCW2307418.1 penicillin-binding protein 1A [Rhodobium gokarnense]
MKFFVKMFGYFFGIGAVFFLIVAAVLWIVLSDATKDLPDYTALKKYEPPVMTRVHASDGSLIAEYARERRLFLPIQAVPDLVKNAFLAAEDKNFYSHPGVDMMGIARAVVTNIKNRGSNRRMVGASTITQQVAKNFLLSNEYSYERKIREAILALRIEQAFTKDEILELYLNEIYLGMGSYGVAAASLLYFDKAVQELTLAEAAYLAALPKAPSNYHPFDNTEAAIERRNWVIDRMVENGMATAEAAEKAKVLPLDVTPRTRGPHLFASDYFAEEVRRRLLERYGEKGLYEGGLSVRGTLDPQLQVLARKALMDGLVEFDRRRRGWRGAVTTIDVSAGDWGPALGKVEALSDVPEWRLAVVLSSGDGEAQIGLQPKKLVSGKLSTDRERAVVPLEHVKWARWEKGPKRRQPIRAVSDVLAPGDVVYVEKDPEGGSDTYILRQVPEVSGAIVAMDPHTGRVLALVGGFTFAKSQFNRATQAWRQPGSSFKPIVYAAALDNGYTPSSVVLDAPISLPMGNGKMWTPKNYGGKFYGPSTLRTGIERSRNVMTVRLAKDMGMPLVAEYATRFGIYDELTPVLSMALGAGETTVLRLTAAYAMIANGGRKLHPTLIDRIQDRRGKTIYKHEERICDACEASSWTGQDEPELIDNREQVLDPMTAYQITSMMEGVVQRGTATRVKAVGKPVAGKTGTTNDERDAWFVGFSPDLAVGVFVGYDTPRPMGRGATGGQVAAPIFTEFMKAALKDKPAVEFRVPPGIKLIAINRRTGMPASGSGGDVILEAFKPGTGPADTYSIIGFDGSSGTLQQVSPAAARAVISSPGGLY